MMSIRLVIGLLIVGGLVAVSMSYAMIRPPSIQQNAASPSGIITGWVLDVDGQPVSRAEVYADRSDFTMGRRPFVLTDEQGKFLIEGLASGTYTVSVAKEQDGYPPTDSLFHYAGSVEVPHVNVNVQQIPPAITIRIGIKAATLVGRIVDAESNRPVEGVQLTLSRVDHPDYSYSTGSDLEGRFKILIPSVPIRVKVSAPGYEDWYYKANGSKRQVDALQLASGTIKELVISLRPIK